MEVIANDYSLNNLALIFFMPETHILFMVQPLIIPAGINQQKVTAMKLSLGVIIGIILIVYWYMQDHPKVAPPTTQGHLECIVEGMA